MTLIPLEQFLGSLERAASENRRAFEDDVARRKVTAATLEKDVERLTKERRKKMRLREQVFAEGMSVGEVDSAVLKIDVELEAANADLARLRTASTDQPVSPFESWDGGTCSVHALGERLRSNGCESALSYANANALYANLPFSFAQVDDDGRPQAIDIDVGGGAIALKLDVGDRFVSEHRPRSLSWVPCVQPHIGERSGQRNLMAVALESPPTWFVTRTMFLVHYDATTDWAGRTTARTAKLDFGNLVHSLHDHVAAEAKKVEPLRMDGQPPSEFAIQLRRRIMESTATVPAHARTSERLASPAIAKRIAPHWSKFVDAPWHRGVAGPLALLKHLVENREVPRFWNEEYESHYGFRVRTRDHDWLVGEVFIGDEAQHDDHQIRVQSRYSPVVATIGSMHLRVGRSQE